MDDDLLAAIQNLVEETDPRYKLDALASVAALRNNYPVVFDGQLAVLNPLLKLQSSNPKEWSKVQTLIEARRLQGGLDLLWPPKPKQKFDPVAYQREAMQRRRARAQQIVAIENATRPDRDQLRGTARLEFERKALADWGAQLKNRLDKNTALAKLEGKPLTKEEIKKIRDDFWAKVDADLEQRARAIRKAPKA